MSMNLTMKLSLLSNTSGTDRLSFSVEKKSTIESPLVNLARVDASGGVKLLIPTGDYFLYIKNLGKVQIKVSIEGNRMMHIDPGEFALAPIGNIGDLTVEASESCSVEYAYWTKG